jgi:uncharacterized protein YjlB
MEPDIKTFVLEPEGDIPNSSLPLILYRYALPPTLRSRSGCQSLFARNQWSGNWVDGIFDYWHFHVTGHEVLGCVAGSALVGFGGDGGVQVEFRAGDVVVIPAGVGHKRLSDKRDGFTVVGGYPPGQSGAIARPGEMSLDEAREAIARLQPPRADPVQGEQGLLLATWGIRAAPLGDGRVDAGGPTDPSR